MKVKGLANQWGYRLFLAVQNRSADEVTRAQDGIIDRRNRKKFRESDVELLLHICTLAQSGKWDEAETWLRRYGCHEREPIQ